MLYRILIILLFSSTLFAQPKLELNKILIGSAIGFMGGVASGYHETTLHHYSAFKRVHPYANDQYFNPALSWTKKWKNGDPLQGEAFPLSSTALVWTTDAKHILGIMSNGSIVIATCVVTIGEKRKWWEYGIDMVASGLARSAGFYLTYNIIYK